uniref:Uncharacterized protein n=1 Tax=Rhizophora mucronata TaxID=61149 RepID=A0A2P2QS49_RHIMU
MIIIGMIPFYFICDLKLSATSAF